MFLLVSKFNDPPGILHACSTERICRFRASFLSDLDIVAPHPFDNPSGSNRRAGTQEIETILTKFLSADSSLGNTYAASTAHGEFSTRHRLWLGSASSARRSAFCDTGLVAVRSRGAILVEG